MALRASVNVDSVDVMEFLKKSLFNIFCTLFKNIYIELKKNSK
jgi:hypothetical protein